MYLELLFLSNPTITTSFQSKTLTKHHIMSSSNSGNRIPNPSASAHTRPGLTRTNSAMAKRSPSILVTDVRKNQIKAPFAGKHKLETIQRSVHNDRHAPPPRKPAGSNIAQRLRRPSSTKYSDISVSNIISNISDIPSSRQREAPRYLNSKTGAIHRIIPQYYKTLPSRTSKLTQKLVLIPDSGDGLLYGQPQQHQQQQPEEEEHHEQTTTENIFEGGNYVRTRAEKMTKEQRAYDYPRVTAYLVSEGFNLNITSQFLSKYHSVSPRLYDDALYVLYTLPLLPGENGYRVQSNNSEKNQKGNKLMESLLDKVEQRDYHFEFYSAADSEINEIVGRSTSPIPMQDSSGNPGEFPVSQSHSSDFDPSEPQYFVSSSPSASIMDLEAIQEEKENNGSGSSSGSAPSSPIASPIAQGIVNNLSSALQQAGNSSNVTNDEDVAVESDHDSESEDVTITSKREKRSKRKSRTSSNKRRTSHVDYSKHAEMFILDYGVVVFWNFTEIHEKNILADLVFAKIEPGEFQLDSQDEEDDDDEDEEEDSNGIWPFVTINSEDNSNSSDDDEEPEPISLIIKPVPEHDIETEEFHFEYIKDITTPRIYNDMITLKSGDHMIKLTISHAIAQSTKLSLFESKMSNILNSISRLPKLLALTGKLANYTRKKLLIKTGRLFQLRNEVNLSSNILDTPEIFWDIEVGLDPLYTAIRDYLEIDQRVEVLNDRCKVFLDFFDIVADSLAERAMTKITLILIIAIGVSVAVSVLEIFIRYLIIHG